MQISKKLISNGIVFLWSDKRILSEIVDTMENKGFVYIENLVIVHLNLRLAYEKLKEVLSIQAKDNQIEELVLQNLNLIQEKIGVKELLHR